MEHLTLSQTGLGAEIQRIISNFKKDSGARKSTTDYFIARLEQLDAAWEKFEGTDSDIRSLPDVQLEHEYFTSDYYNTIKQLYNKYSQLFKDALAQLNPKPTVASLEDQQSSPQKPFNNHLETLIRRQRAMMTSLGRIINGKTKDIAPAQCLLAVDKRWNQIEEIHYSVWETSADPAIEGYDMQSYIDLESQVLQTRAALGKATLHVQQGETAKRVVDHPPIQLPKMSIPRFDGDYLKWQTFSDIFTKMIHDQQLPPIQKMWYLKTNVSGDAERLLRHLELTEDNYNIAWNILQDRFSNKRALTSALLQRILSLPTLTSEMKAIREFHDGIHECLAALKTLGIETTNWDPLLIHLLVKKLDRQNHLLYEQSLKNPRDLQTIEEFLGFLKNRFEALEVVSLIGGRDKAKAVTAVATSNYEGCKVCGIKGHPLYYCERFLKMSAAERLKWTQKRNLCVNCFKAEHTARSCPARCCTKCTRKHNTLLHLGKSSITSQNQKTSEDQNKSKPSTENPPPPTVAAINQVNNKQGYVILATAKVLITANNGKTCEARAILDSGSQVNLITERLVRRLAVAPTPSSLCIEGIGRRSRTTTQRINLELQSIAGNFACRLEAFILPNIVSPQPTQNLDTASWSIPENIKLADSNFHRSDKIDVLLGAEFYHLFTRPEQIRIGDKMPILQNTVFGWVVAGKIGDPAYKSATCGIFCEEESTNELIERFWKLDDFDNAPRQLTAAERYCETHFAQNISKCDGGRFIVRLPFRENGSALGDSRQTAMNRFLALERRLDKDPKLREDYVRFMDEYESLNHMEEIKLDTIRGPHFFIPHHCVLKPDSSTTKLRVVFDASAKTSSGLSLNDILHTGPTIQSELFSIPLRFRLHKYVFTADIEKMYRQIRIQEEDQGYQLIIWRRQPKEEIKYFKLKTVTYGTSSAPTWPLNVYNT